MRKINKKEFNKIIAFANEQFNLDFETYLPRLYSDDKNYKYHYIYEVNHELWGMFLAKPLKYGRLKLLGLGTVCVDKVHRNKGVMQEMFNFIVEDLEPNYDIIYLSGDKARYEKFGYYKSGAKCILRLKAKNFFDLDITNVAVFDISNDIEKLDTVDLAVKKAFRSQDSLNDILKKADHNVYLVKENKDVSYAIYNKIANEVVELIGNINEKKVLKALLKENNKEDIYYSLDVKKAKALYNYADNYGITNLVNLKVVNYQKVISELLLAVKDKKNGSLELRFVDKTLKITVNGKTVKVTMNEEINDVPFTEQEIIDILFGNINFVSEKIALDVNLISSWFPLPLPPTLASIDGV